jgi:hypothetical protein
MHDGKQVQSVKASAKSKKYPSAYKIENYFYETILSICLLTDK